MANKRVRSCNTLAYNGSVHPKKLEKLMQLRELSPFMPKAEEFHPENMSPQSEGERASPGTAHTGIGTVGSGATNGSDSSNGYHSNSAQRRSKRMLPARAVEILNKWYFEHLSYPYPTEEEKAEIARQGGLNVSQVTCWFANKRNRSHNTKKVKQQIFEYMAQKREQEEKGKPPGSEGHVTNGAGHVTSRSPPGGDSVQSSVRVKVEMTL